MTRFNQLPPAIVALLIQLSSLIFIALVLSGLWQFNKIKLAVSDVVLFQAAMTLIITRCTNLEWWWSIIQPLFPVAIVCTAALMLPPLFYFLIFSFLLVFYWSTYRTRVPYYPSTKEVWQVVEQQLPNKPISFADIGSGLGGLVLHLGKKYPESQFVGIEIAPLPWLLSYLRPSRKNTRFDLANYKNIHFSRFDVVFAYLSPAAMPDLWKKASQEMRAGTLLISAEFAVEGVEPDLCICPKNRVPVYLWRLRTP